MLESTVPQCADDLAPLECCCIAGERWVWLKHLNSNDLNYAHAKSDKVQGQHIRVGILV
jgi:hypothetical protein